MLRTLIRLVVVIGLVVILGLPRGLPVLAQVSNCSVNISPATLTAGTTSSVNYDITNTSGQTVSWIRIARPNANYSFVGISQQGWSDNTQSDSSVLTGGSLAAGATFSLQVAMNASLVNSPATAWTVQVSDDAGGANPTNCGGANNTTSITGHPPNDSDNAVYSVTVKDITATSATITWGTFGLTGALVYYGKTDGYGMATAYDSTQDPLHSVTLTGLTGSTGYHFQVAGMDDSLNASYSADGTFLTDLAPPAPPTPTPKAGSGTSGGTTQVGSGAVTTVTGKPTETVPPTVAITSALGGIYHTPPAVSGTASDNEAVAKVEYSIDGGKNWSSAGALTAAKTTVTKGKKTTTTTSTTSVTFTFTPVITEDGNYPIAVRATDPSGNQAVTAVKTIVIDRLPPRFGGELTALGSQVVEPDKHGNREAVVGVDQAITLGAVGGPTDVTVKATLDGSKQSAGFHLRRNATNGLWQGIMSFMKPGTYGLSVVAVDGAGNHAEQTLAPVEVLKRGLLTDRAGQPLGRGKVTVYFKQPGSGQWTVWDGAGFGQANPQTVGSNGAFQTQLPAGTYYLRAESPGYKTLLTRQFTLDQPTPLVPTLKLAASPKLGFGKFSFTLPWVSFDQASVATSVAPAKATGSPLIGRPMPAFSLPTGNGGTTSTVGLLGKPTVISVISTWSPNTSEQLPALAKLRANTDLNIVPLTIGEQSGRVQAYLGRSGYDDLPVTLDADATLGHALGVPSLPTHYVLDRKGIVRAILTGVVPADELLSKLAG